MSINLNHTNDQISTSSGNLRAVGQPFVIQLMLAAGDNNTYTLVEYATFPFTINKAYYECASGSVTAAITINGTNVTGLSALSVTSPQANTTATAANAVAAGNIVKCAFSSNSSATLVSVMLDCTRS